MFDQTLSPRGKNARPVGTVSLSIALHAGAVAIIVALQLTSSIHGLDVDSPLTAYVAPTVSAPVVPPRVRLTVRSPAPSADAAPAVEPATISTEPPEAAPPAPPGVPIGLTVGAPGDARSRFSDSNMARLDGPPPPKASPARIGGDIRAPERLVYVAPVYPSVARIARVEGEVVLEATIDETGVVRDVKVLHSIALLDRAAVDAVSEWRYSPTLLNGRAVPVIMLVRVKFSLK